VFGLYDGYKKGFLLVVIGFLAYIIGIVGAFKLMQIGIDFLIVYFPHMPQIVPLISFVSIFLSISIGIYLLGMLLKQVLNYSVFSGNLDNIMGAVVGLCQWIFMLSIAVWLIKQTDFIVPDSVTKDSLIFRYLDDLAPYVVEKLRFFMPFAHDLFKSIHHIFKEL
jgi:membrane protein required for colicin V production